MDLVTQAAQIRRWSPTRLLRTAVLDRAAHIVNLSRETSFDFKGLASEIAERLVKDVEANREEVEAQLEADAAGAEFDGTRPYPTIRVPVLALQSGPLSISAAARLGGSEFLNLVVEIAKGMRGQSGLPDPVDPDRLSQP